MLWKGFNYVSLVVALCSKRFYLKSCFKPTALARGDDPVAFHATGLGAPTIRAQGGHWDLPCSFFFFSFIYY